MRWPVGRRKQQPTALFVFFFRVASTVSQGKRWRGQKRSTSIASLFFCVCFRSAVFSLSFLFFLYVALVWEPFRLWKKPSCVQWTYVDFVARTSTCHNAMRKVTLSPVCELTDARLISDMQNHRHVHEKKAVRWAALSGCQVPTNQKAEKGTKNNENEEITASTNVFLFTFLLFFSSLIKFGLCVTRLGALSQVHRSGKHTRICTVYGFFFFNPHLHFSLDRAW